jgi:hypothetical protein
MDETCLLGIIPTMNFDWRGNVILQKLAEGSLIREAGEAAGITKRAVHLRMKASPSFREAVALAREQGRDEWKFRRFLAHPNRGRRGVWWKPGVVPAYRYGRQ